MDLVGFEPTTTRSKSNVYVRFFGGGAGPSKD